MHDLSQTYQAAHSPDASPSSDFLWDLPLQAYTQKVLGARQSPHELLLLPPPHVHSLSEPKPRALMSMARACCFSYGRILLESTISWTCAPRLRVLSADAG